MTAGLPVQPPGVPWVRRAAVIAAATAALAVAGCGAGGSSDPAAGSVAPPSSTTSTSTHKLPTIAGAATGSVMVGTLYSFQPTASDPDGNTLTFSKIGRAHV